MIFDTAWAFLYYIFLLTCCGYAIVRGDRSEYFGAAIMIIGSLSTLVVARLIGTSWSTVEIGIFAIDIVVLVAFIQLTLKSERFWPMWATAFQLLAVSVHTAMMVVPKITPWAFGTGAVFWAYPMLLALVIGSYEHTLSVANQEIDSG